MKINDETLPIVNKTKHPKNKNKGVQGTRLKDSHIQENKRTT